MRLILLGKERKDMKDDIIIILGREIAKNILKQPDREIGPEEPLISSRLIDSFHLIDLALLVEDIFGVHIDDTELNSEVFDTISQLSDMIRSRNN